ncbi:MAG: hypothetical protein WCV00_05970 [Verrucomicrobiia bacterium]|jgi:hypothetical protein
MNNPGAPNTNVISKPSTHLLGRIRAILESVGDGLNDIELTRLLLQATLPTEKGFAFLSFADGCVTLTVPQQDLANWYPNKGWIAPEKEAIGKAIAEKCGFSLYEPPDAVVGFDASGVRHHLSMSNLAETIVIAHSRYLKIRLFDTKANRPLPLPENILEQLAALYPS